MSNTVLDTVRTWTMTNLFLVPLLGISRIGLGKKGFINAFIKDEVKGVDYLRGIYLLFKPQDPTEFEEFLASERERKAKIIDEYDYPKGLVMVVYQYDEKWEKDIYILMTGKYSQVSTEFKGIFPVTKKISGSSKEFISIHHGIFRKTQEYIDYWKEELGLDIDWKEDEVWPFYSEREYFTQETLDKL